MTIEQILEIIERYKLRIPPTVYYDLLADVREAEEEQEPFKPMVEIDLDYVIKQKYIEREVLDKIRAELHATAEMHEDGDYYLRDEWIDEYFDKYKAETEAEDENKNNSNRD